MTNSQRLATVRAHLRRWLCENVAPSDDVLAAACDDPSVDVNETPEVAANETADASLETDQADAAPSEESDAIGEDSSEVGPKLSLADSEPTESVCPSNEEETGSVAETFETQLPEIRAESILIRDGFYAGRSFDAVASGESYRATWFMEPDELKIRDSAGEVVAVFQGDEIVSGLDESVFSDDHQPATIPLPMPAADSSQDQRDSDDDQAAKAA